MVQLTGVVTVFVWTAIVTWVCLRIVGAITPLRIEQNKEMEGLDINDHEEKGYSL